MRKRDRNNNKNLKLETEKSNTREDHHIIITIK